MLTSHNRIELYIIPLKPRRAILSCGRPLVATDAGALPEILSDPRLGRLVEFTSKSVAIGILEVANLLQQNIMTPENICSAYLEGFNPEKVGHRYIEFFNSLEINKWT